MKTLYFAICCLSCIILSSCHITLTETTRCLFERGVVYESVSQPSNIIKAQDGELASECTFDYSFKDIYLGIECIGDGKYTSIHRKQKYVIIEKEKLFEEVRRQVKEKVEADSDHRYSVDISMFIKQISPSDFEVETFPQDLPEKFRINAEAKAVNESYPCILNIDGIEYEVYFENDHHSYNNTRRYERLWWGYPFLIFAPATIAIDFSSTLVLLAAAPVIITVQKISK